MPNWVTNKWLIIGDTDDIKQIRTIMASDYTEDGITFDKLIPMPDVISKLSTGFTDIDGEKVSRWVEFDSGAGKILKRKITEEEHRLIEKTGYADWHDWSVGNWGTKWDASHSHMSILNATTLRMEFDTAWAPPEPVIVELTRRFPKVTISAKWRDEMDDEGEWKEL